MAREKTIHLLHKCLLSSIFLLLLLEFSHAEHRTMTLGQKVHFESEALVRHTRQNDQICYGVMMDAGSSGTRAYVYDWPCRDTRKVPEIDIAQPAPSLKLSPGISSFVQNVSGVTEQVLTLLSWAREIVPASQVAQTPVFLRATAGMRLLSVPDQNKILDAVRAAFGSSGFYFASPSWARIIGGDEEGAFGWLALNYLAKRVSSAVPPSKTALVIDLGGASVQITFVPDSPPTANGLTLDLININRYQIYTYSWLGYGNDQARENINAAIPVDNSGVKQNPCFNTGFTFMQGGVNSTGTSNAAACVELINKYLNLTSCNGRPDCSVGGVYLPPIPSSLDIYGISAVQYVSTFLGFPTTVTLNQLLNATTVYCAKSYNQVVLENPGVGATLLQRYCFQGAYVYALLANGFKINPNTVLNVPETINDIATTWALGAQMFDISLLPCSPLLGDNCPTVPPAPCPNGNSVIINLNFDRMFG